MVSLPHVDAPLRLVVRHEDGVPVLVVPDALAFDALREWMRAHLPEVVASLGGRACRLDLGARELQLFDVRRLLHLLRDDFQVEATGLYVRAQAVHRYAERELKLKLFLREPGDAPAATEPELLDPMDAPLGPLPGLQGLLAVLDGSDDDEAGSETVDAPNDAEALTEVEVDPEVDADDGALDATDNEEAPLSLEPSVARRPVPLPDLSGIGSPKDGPEVDDHGGRRVLTLSRTLRSGTAITYEGDVHVYGDVNAGAQVRAGGSVVVFGRLRGMVHAGAMGREDAFVLAFEMSPTQVRIHKLIATVPARSAPETFLPEIARVRDGSVVIESWQGRWITPTTRHSP